MKSLVCTVCSLLVLTTLYGQWNDNYIRLSSKITTEKMSHTDFNQIDVGEDFEVYIHFSDGPETVEIEANENLHELIEVEKMGNTLKIDTKSYSTNNKYGGANEVLVAHITMKDLVDITASEDVVIELKDKLTTEALSIQLDEDCQLEGEISVQQLTVDLNEDAAADLEGTAHSADMELNEDSHLKGYGLAIHDLVIRLREDSAAKLTVNGNIDLRAGDDSDFYYKGNGTFIRKRLTGDAEMKHW
ncbi:MAG: DUF2807 domain-containing protein [Bacteroidota bacterium]